MEIERTEQEQEQEQSQKKDKKIWNIIIIVSVCLFLVCGFLLGRHYIKRRQAEKVYTDMKDEYVSLMPNSGIPGSQNNSGHSQGLLAVDFEGLQKVNPDVYAWLDIPGTTVSYPVLQHPEDDAYYLNRTIDHREGLPGSLYSQRITSTYFYEYVHIIYGHNMKNKSMFGALHNYEEEGYLKDHSYAYVYTPECIYVYQLFASAVVGDEHFASQYNFSTQEGRAAYIEKLYNPELDSAKSHYLEGPEAATENKFLILSTCMSSNKELRYTVHGVLKDIINK